MSGACFFFTIINTQPLCWVYVDCVFLAVYGVFMVLCGCLWCVYVDCVVVYGVVVVVIEEEDVDRLLLYCMDVLG